MTVTIRCNGPEPECRAAALTRAAELGYTDPRVVRVVAVQGTRSTLLAVVVADGEEAAEAERQPRRRPRVA
jgi:hypothetical protein